jgi:Domain of unknown function (DUF4192)
MNIPPSRIVVRPRSVADMLAAIPFLLGFIPESSLVVIGIKLGRVDVVFRYDLPDPSDRALAALTAGHMTRAMAASQLSDAVVVGYGPGQLVTPLMDAIREAAGRAGLQVLDALRVHDGRFWSYQCTDPACCPAEGKVLDLAQSPVAVEMARAAGQDGRRAALPTRAELAATLAPVTGPAARRMSEATRRADRARAGIIARGGLIAIYRPGLATVRHALRAYRDGGGMLSDAWHAWLSVVLTVVRIRDDAWARMDPAHARAHLRLWTDTVRRAQAGYVAAPASLLALTAWQLGEGALANIAIARALEDVPGYSLARLLADAQLAGAPPSMAVPPLTPGEVAENYGDEAAAD